MFKTGSAVPFIVFRGGLISIPVRSAVDWSAVIFYLSALGLFLEAATLRFYE